MKFQYDQFNQGKLDRLKNDLSNCISQGKPKPFEIWIDNYKVVPKTINIEDFEAYQSYITPNSHEVRFVVYSSEASHRAEKFVFLLKATDPEHAVTLGLMGTPVRSFSSKDISSWRQKHESNSREVQEIQELQDEIAYLREELNDREEEIENLHVELEEANEKGGTLGGLNLGKVLANGANELIRMNTHIWGQFPGLNGLAGLMEEDTKAGKNKQREIPQPDSEVSFRKKETPESGMVLTTQEKEFLAFFKQIQKHFSQSEVEQLIAIIDLLSKDKTQLPEVLDLLQDGGAEGNETKN